MVDTALRSGGPVVLGRVNPGRPDGPRQIAAIIATPTAGADAQSERSVTVHVLEADAVTGLRSTHAFLGMIGNNPTTRDLFDRGEDWPPSRGL